MVVDLKGILDKKEFVIASIVGKIVHSTGLMPVSKNTCNDSSFSLKPLKRFTCPYGNETLCNHYLKYSIKYRDMSLDGVTWSGRITPLLGCKGHRLVFSDTMEPTKENGRQYNVLSGIICGISGLSNNS